MTEWVDAAGAVASLTATDKVVLPPGCGGVTVLQGEMAAQAGRLEGLRVYSGMLLDDYTGVS